MRTEIAKDKYPLFLRNTFSLDKAPGSSASIILSTIVDDAAVFISMEKRLIASISVMVWHLKLVVLYNEPRVKVVLKR